MLRVGYELMLDHETEALIPGSVNYVLSPPRRSSDSPMRRGKMEAQSHGSLNYVLSPPGRSSDSPVRRGEMKAQSPDLINYILNHEQLAYDMPKRRGANFDYVLAADGLYIQAKRKELEICLRLAPVEVHGLDKCFEKFAFRLPKVPINLINQILYISTSYAQDSMERIFWLEHSPNHRYDDGWSICHPLQRSSAVNCHLIEGQDEALKRVIIVIHSRHSMPARFLEIDDKEDTSFRIYGVIGGLTKKSEIRLRIGCFGYFWEIPASWVLKMPAGLIDCCGVS